MSKGMTKFFHPKTPKEYAERDFIVSLNEEAKIEKQIERLESKLDKITGNQNWIRQIVMPMAKRIGELIGRPVVDVSGAHGVCARVNMDFYKTEADLKRSKERRGGYKRRPYDQ